MPLIWTARASPAAACFNAMEVGAGGASGDKATTAGIGRTTGRPAARSREWSAELSRGVAWRARTLLPGQARPGCATGGGRWRNGGAALGGGRRWLLHRRRSWRDPGSGGRAPAVPVASRDARRAALFASPSRANKANGMLSKKEKKNEGEKILLLKEGQKGLFPWPKQC